ncbi:MAG: hypothetical protein ACRESG_08850 [Gammaproteobacteria bacterium]
MESIESKKLKDELLKRARKHARERGWIRPGLVVPSLQGCHLEGGMVDARKYEVTAYTKKGGHLFGFWTTVWLDEPEPFTVGQASDPYAP